MNRNRSNRGAERGTDSPAKAELIRLRDREHPGDLKEQLSRIVKAGEQVEQANDGKAWWDNYLLNYKFHDYDRK